jgi:hypothetical protein
MLLCSKQSYNSTQHHTDGFVRAGNSIMKIKQLVREYALATYYGANGRPGRLLPMAIRLTRARLKYGIGPVPFSAFNISNVPEVRWIDYLVKKSTSDSVLLAMNHEDAHRFARNKVLFYEHCQRAGLPTIPIICRVGGTPDPVGHAVELVKDAERLAILLGSAPRQLFAKSIAGSYGADAFLIARRGTGFEFDGRIGTATELLAYLRQRCDEHTGFVIQPQVRPHVNMLPLASANGLPTTRVVTAMSADGPEALFACLKIPVGPSITDNFAHGAGGNLLAGIDLESGTLTCATGSRRRDWPVMTQVDHHPDSSARITGSQLPFWREVLQTALQGQASLPDFKTIGWDVAATPAGVVLVEANSKYDMDILQIAHQRGLKSEWAAKLHITIN